MLATFSSGPARNSLGSLGGWASRPPCSTLPPLTIDLGPEQLASSYPLSVGFPRRRRVASQ
eukprot:4770443-Pyramimonas_sp.AAC.1